MNTEATAELELLELLVKTCRSLRDPRRRKSRTEMAIPAARWEMRFEEQISKLSQDTKKTQPVAAAA